MEKLNIQLNITIRESMQKELRKLRYEHPEVKISKLVRPLLQSIINEYKELDKEQK